MHYIARPLRFVDLVVGKTYLSPSGRLCRMLPMPEGRGKRSSIVFEYCDQLAARERDPQFHISIDNLLAIECMREVCW